MNETLAQILISAMAGAGVSVLGAGLTVYVNQRVFGDRLTRAERDIEANKATHESDLVEIRREVTRMGNDVSWIRGKLEGQHE